MQISPWLAGMVGGFISFVVISGMEGPLQCRDGWYSSSIGKQGACSHHGGVRRSSALMWSLLIAIGSGIAAAQLPRQTGAGSKPTGPADGVGGSPQASQPAVPSPRQIAPPTQSPLKSMFEMHFVHHCTKCSSGMKAVMITVGDRPNGAFWECVNSGCGSTEPREEAAPRFSELRSAKRPKRR